MKLAIGIRIPVPCEAKDTLFVNCFWPKLDAPTRIFTEGSSGIKVMGTTPRNIWFPDDIEFVPFYPDALYPAEMAVKTAFPFNRRGMVNLSPAESAVWLEEYNKVVASLPATAAVIETPRHVNFLRVYTELSRRSVTLKEDSISKLPDGSVSILKAGAVIEKVDYEESAIELTTEECIALVDGEITEAELRAQKAAE